MTRESRLAWANIDSRSKETARWGAPAQDASSKEPPTSRETIRRVSFVSVEPATPSQSRQPVAVAPALVVGEESGRAAMMFPPMEVEEHVPQEDVILLAPYGVGPDQPGLADNISGRVGATYYSVDNAETAGGVMILEGTKQFRSSDFFGHAGVAAEYLGGEWPVSTTVGISRLATIVDDQVVEPWVLDVSYDSYIDTNFFGTGDTVYLDQMRMLAGYALTPRFDAGVWAAVGMRSASGSRAVEGGRQTVSTGFGDRIAVYGAANVGELGSHVIYSAGWEEGPGNFFMEANAFVPLTQNVNFWGGAGYSDSGSYDVVAGLEFTLGRRGRQSSSHCEAYACAPQQRYRGGWANDTYRGALRVVTPTRARRMMEDPRWRFEPTPTIPNDPPLPPANPGTEPPVDPGPGTEPPVDPGPGTEPPVDPGPGTEPPVDPGPGTEPPVDPEDECLDRVPDRERRESRLSLLLGSMLNAN